MSLPCRSFISARDYALAKSRENPKKTWYINRLASSGNGYEVSETPITDTSFGGGVLARVINNEVIREADYERRKSEADNLRKKAR
jgi:hypothetical protein